MGSGERQEGGDGNKMRLKEAYLNSGITEMEKSKQGRGGDGEMKAR